MFYYWVILIIGFIILWLFLGRNNTEFVGLNPLFSSQPLPPDPLTMNPFLNHQLKQKVQKPIKALPSNQVQAQPSNNNRFHSKGQKLCCQIMEEIYGEKFVSIRPQWLKNPETGGLLEIDCYNDKLKIGVEYNGIQHYVYPNIYHKSLTEFKNQVRRDQYKVKKCEENGVYLITVPYNIAQNKIKEFILSNIPIEDFEDDPDDEGTDAMMGHSTDDGFEDEDEDGDGDQDGHGDGPTDDIDFTDMENQVSMIIDPKDPKMNIPTTVCYQEYLA
jgi:hypothetical protein